MSAGLGPLRASALVLAFVVLPALAHSAVAASGATLAGSALAGSLAQVALAALFARSASAYALPLLPAREAVLRGVATGLLVGTGLVVLLAALSFGVAQLLPAPASQRALIAELLHPRTASEAAVVALAVGVLAPYAEERFFRGQLFPGIRKTTSGGAGLALSALAFGIAHGHPTNALPATLAGLVLGALAWRTGSLVAATVAHAAHNLAPLLLAALGLEIRGLGADPALPSVASLAVGLVALVVGFAAAPRGPATPAAASSRG